MKLKVVFILICILNCNCVKKDKIAEPLLLEPKSGKLYIGQQIIFKTNKKDVEWKSSDEFVAKISKQGVMTAHHIGEAKIIARSKDEKMESEIIVIPQIINIYEPVIKFGITKEEIKAMEKRKLINETLISLSYQPESDEVKSLYYLFENNVCSYAIVKYGNINESRIEDILTYYNERYEYLGIHGIDHYFADEKRKTAIAISIKGDIVIRYTTYSEK